MFQNKELDLLRQHKELLVLQCNTQRRLLAVECQQLRSPAYWLGETGKAAKQHPVLTTVLAAGAGWLAVQVLRKPRGNAGLAGRVMKLFSFAPTIWKIASQFRRV
jgi:hypothetical protein